MNAALETCNESVENDEGKNLEYEIIGIIESHSVFMKNFLLLLMYSVLSFWYDPYHNNNIKFYFETVT